MHRHANACTHTRSDSNTYIAANPFADAPSHGVPNNVSICSTNTVLVTTSHAQRLRGIVVSVRCKL